jgi:hypothetical protein
MQRRTFLLSALASPLAFGARMKVDGPGAKYRPRMEAAFVRRKEDYGIFWPGAIWDGEQARTRYEREAKAAAERLGIQLTMRAEPIYSKEEAAAWLDRAKEAKTDGLLLLLLDRQQHTWPTAEMAAQTGIPVVVFSPVGTSFTTNTGPLARKSGVFIASTNEFSQAEFGMKMVKTGVRLREMRFLVLKGGERKESVIEPFGTKLRWVPAKDFLAEYERTPVDEEVTRLAQRQIAGATRMAGCTRADVLNGVRSYVVARRMMEREQADGITMDCLGALGDTKVSLPCISWSTMLDDGIPAACEADLGAAVTHALVQFLFDKPGFQQDPVAETAKRCLIGAHCTCPTKLAGLNKPPEPYFLSNHHGRRDAVPVPRWRIGQRVTVADVLLPGKGETAAKMLASVGTVTENVAVPPSGGCVVSVALKLDGDPELLDYPGFHQVFFYGDHRRDLLSYARLWRMEEAGFPS